MPRYIKKALRLTTGGLLRQYRNFQATHHLHHYVDHRFKRGTYAWDHMLEPLPQKESLHPDMVPIKHSDGDSVNDSMDSVDSDTSTSDVDIRDIKDEASHNEPKGGSANTQQSGMESDPSSDMSGASDAEGHNHLCSESSYTDTPSASRKHTRHSDDISLDGSITPRKKKPHPSDQNRLTHATSINDVNDDGFSIKYDSDGAKSESTATRAGSTRQRRLAARSAKRQQSQQSSVHSNSDSDTISNGGSRSDVNSGSGSDSTPLRAKPVLTDIMPIKATQEKTVDPQSGPPRDSIRDLVSTRHIHDFWEYRSTVVAVADAQGDDLLRIAAAHYIPQHKGNKSIDSIKKSDDSGSWPREFRRASHLERKYCSWRNTIPASKAHKQSIADNADAKRSNSGIPSRPRKTTTPMLNLTESLLAQYALIAESEYKDRPKPFNTVNLDDETHSAPIDSDNYLGGTEDPWKFDSSHEASKAVEETTKAFYRILESMSYSRNQFTLNTFNVEGDSLFTAAFLAGVPENAIANARRRAEKVVFYKRPIPFHADKETAYIKRRASSALYRKKRRFAQQQANSGLSEFMDGNSNLVNNDGGLNSKARRHDSDDGHDDDSNDGDSDNRHDDDDGGESVGQAQDFVGSGDYVTALCDESDVTVDSQDDK
ncbi:hypothetical protein BASA60_011201 [Batrachochytrium salamandrivorans]|nr:hypothetical protein BASA60_011201 [Batrachochytrium salamandrivorans]